MQIIKYIITPLWIQAMQIVLVLFVQVMRFLLPIQFDSCKWNLICGIQSIKKRDIFEKLAISILP